MKFLLLSAFVASTVAALPSSFIDIAADERALNNLIKRSDLFPRDDGAVDGFNDQDGKNCLTKARAQVIANNFKTLIANYTESFANSTLTVDFTDYSDSVNELINGGCTNGSAKLGSPTFSSRAQFEAGQGGQPPIPFQQLNIWHTCHAVTLRWYSAQSPQRVTGIIVFETVPAPAGSKYKDLIKLVFSEFNSGAWLVNLGVFKPTCA